MNIKLASEIVFDSIVDGTGLRATIYFQGCKHHCKGCHNPQTWDISQGVIYSIDEVVKQLLQNPLNKGITLSGGDPLLQSVECFSLIKELKKHGYDDFWIYTGYTWEEILDNPFRLAVVKEADVLVDGKFEEENYYHSLIFKGSSNQRVIDIQKSLFDNCISEIHF